MQIFIITRGIFCPVQAGQRIFIVARTLLDIFHATPQSSQRLILIAFDNRRVASVAALRETKMSNSVRRPASP
jgi:hypothetical protein